MNLKDRDNIDELLNQIDITFNEFSDYLKDKANSEDDKKHKESALMVYWVKDYLKYQKKLDKNNKRYIKYGRGDILKVNFGYNVGSEFGGLHYCINITKNDNINNKVLTVIPLTSKQKASKFNQDLFLNDSLTKSLISCLNDGISKLDLLMARNESIQNIIETAIQNVDKNVSEIVLTEDTIRYLNNYNLEVLNNNGKLNISEAINLLSEVRNSYKEMDIQENDIRKQIKNIKKLSNNSVALCGQITTISKERIYSPKNTSDILYKARIDLNALDKIDKKIIELYTK